MVIPRNLREEAGLVEGALLKISVVKGGRFLVTPQVPIDRPIVEGRRGSRKQLLRELARVLEETRAETKQRAIDRMPKREIDAAVAAARADLAKNRRSNAK